MWAMATGTRIPTSAHCGAHSFAVGEGHARTGGVAAAGLGQPRRATTLPRLRDRSHRPRRPAAHVRQHRGAPGGGGVHYITLARAGDGPRSAAAGYLRGLYRYAPRQRRQGSDDGGRARPAVSGGGGGALGRRGAGLLSPRNGTSPPAATSRQAAPRRGAARSACELLLSERGGPVVAVSDVQCGPFPMYCGSEDYTSLGTMASAARTLAPRGAMC